MTAVTRGSACRAWGHVGRGMGSPSQALQSGVTYKTMQFRKEQRRDLNPA